MAAIKVATMTLVGPFRIYLEPDAHTEDSSRNHGALTFRRLKKKGDGNQTGHRLD